MEALADALIRAVESGKWEEAEALLEQMEREV